MLKNFTNEVKSLQTVNEVLSLLNVLPNNFYLTGSRYFGNARETSDWDLFAETSARHSLVRLGFKPISTDVMVDIGYDRSQFSEVLELKLEDGVIQIQLITNIHAKFKVQEMIKKNYLSQFNSLEKKDRKDFWSLLLKLVG